MTRCLEPVAEPSTCFVAVRPRRVLVLLLAIIVLSIADLVVTLTHMTTIGMVEANPIAAWLVETTGAAWPLAVYKVTTVGICVSVLFAVRRHREGEIAAWLALSVLVALCFIWRDYANEVEMHGGADLLLADVNSDDWILID